MNNVLLSTILILSAILLFILSIYGIRKRTVPGALYFSFVMLAMTIHSVGYAFELLSDNLESMYLCLRIEYIGAAFYPFLFILFTRTYTDEKKFANKFVLYFVFLINVVTTVLVNTTFYNFWYYNSVSIDSSLGFNVLASQKGDWYYVQAFTLFFSICYGMISLFIRFINSKGNYRKRVGCILIGNTIPMITFIFYILHLIPTHLDYTTFSFLFISIPVCFGLFKFDTLFLVPITYETIFNSIDEAVIVIDYDKFLVNFNSAAKQFFPSLNNLKIGQSVNLISELKNSNFILENSILEIEDKVLNVKLIRIKKKKVNIYVATDITEAEKAKRQLEILARVDELTGLYNRRYFMKNFNSSLHDGIFAIIDIDNFKSINDTYGHTEGDKVLNVFGNTFKESFNKEQVCRYGGEEFALFIENVDEQKAYKLVEMFRKKIDINKDKINFTFSAGIAKYRNGHISEAIIQADKKLYEAKANGRNQTRY